MKHFILYPSVYIRSTLNGVLLYDTHTELKFYFIGNDGKAISHISKGFIPVTKNNSDIINKLYANNFGYYVDCNQNPIVLNSISFTSSKAKMAEYSQILDGGNSFSYIEKISLFVDALNNEYTDKRIFTVLDFPVDSISSDEMYIYSELFKIVNFPNLKEIEIVSSLSHRALSLALELTKLEYLVTFKTIITEHEQIDFSIFRKYSNIIFKILAQAKLLPFRPRLKSKNTILTYWSDNLEEILNYSTENIIPIIYDAQFQHQLFEEVVINLEDILSIKKTNFELKYNSMFNATFMSKIKLYGNKVLIGNQFIGSVSDITTVLSNSLFDSENLWFYSRNKKASCRDCVFADLCPSISLLEVLNIIDKPCSLKSD